MFRFWVWLKVVFHCIRHIEWWRLAWAAAMVLGLLGWELMRGVESQAEATTLTLLLKPGVEETEAREFLKALPQASASVLREPGHVLAKSQHLLEKLGYFPEGGWPEDGVETGWVAELHWSGLSSALAKQLRRHVEQAAWVEEAYWASPAFHASWEVLSRAVFVLFALGMGGAMAILSLCCLHAEAGRLKVLLALGATPGRICGVWLAQGLVWAVLSGMAAHMLWKLAMRAWGLPVFSAGLHGFVVFGLAWGGGGMVLAWLLRGRTCWA
jgi:hypothetical protein